MRSRWIWVSLAATCFALPAAAQIPSPASAGFTPRVPVSGLARPSLAIDPSRLHVSTSVAFGSYGSRNVSGLQVTSFHYQFKQPLALSLSLGNAWGGGAGRDGSFFLEGLDLTYRPSGSFMIHVGYQDLRSPLQRGFQTPSQGFYGAPWER